MARRPTDQHYFWRHPALLHVEAREVRGGRTIAYGLHSHRAFSIGAVLTGRSILEIGGSRHAVGAGDVVLMNPDEVHACNPRENLLWSYQMLYVDADWLAHVEGDAAFRPLGPPASSDTQLFADLAGLFATLFADGVDAGDKEAALQRFFGGLRQRLGGKAAGRPADPPPAALDRAAALITARCTENLPLADVAAEAGLSPSRLVRAFKAAYGLTPHAYQINRRIEAGQRGLRGGLSIAEAALAAGFADQAHFQRLFKRHRAATPGQYQRAPDNG